MDFLATEDQRALQDGVHAVLAQLLPAERLLEIADGFDSRLWGELTALGVFSLRLPEPDGGLGLGFAETVLAFEELGAALVPGPLVASHLAAGLPGVSAGQVVTIIDRDAVVQLVAHLRSASHVVIISDDGLELVPATNVEAIDLADGIDPLTPLAEVTAIGQGDRVGLAADAGRWRREGALLNAALQVGIAVRLTETAVAFAKQREQFGKAIGSFQAVKHLAADMYVRAELAKVAVEAAAVTLDDPEADPSSAPVSNAGQRAVAGAALLADEAAHLNARSGLQIHGGMGFTWEVPVHLYLKRAWVQATEWGDSDTHAEALAQLL